MENIIIDFERLHSYFVDEFSKHNINLLNNKDTNIQLIKNWLKSLNDSSKLHIINMIKDTVRDYEIKKKKYIKSINNSNISRIPFIILVIIVLIFLWISYTGTDETYVYINNENSGLLLAFTICILAVSIRYYNSWSEKSNYELQKAKTFSEKMSTITNILGDLKSLSVSNLTSINFEESLLTFMNSYENFVANINLGIIVHENFVNSITEYFIEQKSVVYDNLLVDVNLSNIMVDEFIDFILNKQLILDYINIINKNIKNYNISGMKIIKNQDKLVNEFVDNLYHNKDNLSIDRFLSNKISIIFENKLIRLTKYTDFKQYDILKKLKSSINKNQENFTNTNETYENYKALLRGIYDRIFEQTKMDNYMKKEFVVPSKYIRLINFWNLYENLSLSHLQNVKLSTDTTIIKIQNYNDTYQYDINKKHLQDNNTFYYVMWISAMMSCILLTYSTKISDLIPGLENTKKKIEGATYAESFRNKDNRPIYVKRIMTVAIIILIIVLTVKYLYSDKYYKYLNSKNSISNTNKILEIMTNLSNNIEYYICIRNYLSEKNKTNYNKIIANEILENYDYKFVKNDKNFEILNIIKHDKSNNVYFVWDLKQINMEIIAEIYKNTIDLMNYYNSPNNINIVKEIPYPTKYIIVIIICLIITLGIICKLIFDLYVQYKLISDAQECNKSSGNLSKDCETLKNTIDNLGTDDVAVIIMIIIILLIVYAIFIIIFSDKEIVNIK